MDDNDIFQTLNNSSDWDSDYTEPLAEGRILAGRYRLESQAGRGGMGEVWKAYDQTADRFVALKFVPRDIQRYEAAVLGVKETFKTIQELNHQSICPVYTLENDPFYGYYIVMKWLDGETLDQILRRRKEPFSEEMILKILTPVAEALDFAHRFKVIHRDIKPSNIFVQWDNNDIERVYVIDFGLASEIRESMTRVSQIHFDTSGTRPYMPPEQWRGRRQNAQTDQYSLAVVAYELLAGYLPFNSPDFDMLRAAVLNDEPEKIDDVSDTVNQALQKALSKDKEDRYPCCIDFINALRTEKQRPVPKPAQIQKPVSIVKEVEKPEIKKSDIKKPVNKAQIVSDDLQYLKYKTVNNEIIITGYKGKPEKLIIPAEISGIPVTSIGDSAFKECISLTQVKIPKGVTSIGDWAFKNCCFLTQVEIPKGITFIGNWAFNGCRSLKQVELLEGITSIGNYAFQGCYSLSQVKIPEGVTFIGLDSFVGCRSLKQVEIPTSITSFWLYPFVFDFHTKLIRKGFIGFIIKLIKCLLICSIISLLWLIFK